MSYPGDPSYPGGPPPPPPPGPGGPGEIEPRSGIPYATYGQRVIAVLIDGAIITGVFVVIYIVALIAGSIATGLGVLIGLVGYLAVIALYLALYIMGNGGALGQTPGKHLIGIKVVGPAPGPIGYTQGVIRLLGSWVNSLACYIGWLWPLWDDQKRGFHDMIADTRVVVAPPGEKSLGYWWNNFQL